MQEHHHNPTVLFEELSTSEQAEANLSAADKLAGKIKEGEKEGWGTFVVTLESGKTAEVPFMFYIGEDADMIYRKVQPDIEERIK